MCPVVNNYAGIHVLMSYKVCKSGVLLLWIGCYNGFNNDAGQEEYGMRIKMRTVVIDCKDAHLTSDFYSRLLNWEKTAIEPDWILMREPLGGTGLSFQTEPGYCRPVWPEEPGEQQKMLHIDFLVDHLEEAVAHAITCGAVKAPVQYLDGVVVLFDPDGHPFCFFTDQDYRW